MIDNQSQNPHGLHLKYKIQKIVSNPNKGGEYDKHKPDFVLQDVEPSSEYFVLRLDEGGKDANHIKACRIAIHAYADAIEPFIPQLAKDIREKYQAEGMKADKWISVSDRKPEQGEYVLVHALGGRRMASMFKDGRFLCYDLTDEEFAEVEYPLHWQPLPGIPQK